MELTSRRRRVLSTALAVLLAAESVSAVAAAAQVNLSQRAALPGGPQTPPPSAASADTGAAVARSGGSTAAAGLGVAGDRLPDPVAATSADPTPPPAPVAADRPRVLHAAVPNLPKATRSGTSAKASSSPAAHHGRNHVWIPSLGINRSVSWFPCDRSRAPDNYVYRWGCAGTNNVYLMGHAHSVFKPLHDAYVSGRLHKGMKVYYADGKGRVRVYAVRWWRVVAPTTAASWAWASLATPSMTLQTCVGKNSQYRLMVRLTEVDG